MICEVLQEKGKGYKLQTQCGIGKTIKNKKIVQWKEERTQKQTHINTSQLIFVKVGKAVK